MKPRPGLHVFLRPASPSEGGASSMVAGGGFSMVAGGASSAEGPAGLSDMAAVGVAARVRAALDLRCGPFGLDLAQCGLPALG